MTSPYPVVAVDHLHQELGKPVEVRGWLYNRRSSGKLHFLQVRDGTGVVQAVAFAGDLDRGLFDRLGSLPQESALIVRGVVKEDARSPIGVELSLKEAEVVGVAEEFYRTTLEDLSTVRATAAFNLHWAGIRDEPDFVTLAPAH